MDNQRSQLVRTSGPTGVEPARHGGNPLEAALAAYEPSKYNLATPIVFLDRVPPMHRVSVRIVSVNPQTETYKIPGGDKVGLSKVALDKIAAAAGIAWLPERSGQVDRYNNPYRVRYRATARIRDFDGRTRVVYAEKEIDLRGEPSWSEEELGADAREFVRIAKRSNRDPWPQIYQQRQHIHSLAESKAKLRCIRSALGIPVAMAPADVAKPFVVPALVPDLDTSDPEIKRMMAASLIGEEAALYGPQATPRGAMAPAVDEVEEEAAPEDVVDVSEMTEAPGAEPVSASDQDPWDAHALELAARCPLPVDETTIGAIGDQRRRQFVTILNQVFAALVELIGRQQADSLVAHFAPGFDPLSAPLSEIRALGEALKSAERSEREARR